MSEDLFGRPIPSELVPVFDGLSELLRHDMDKFGWDLTEICLAYYLDTSVQNVAELLRKLGEVIGEEDGPQAR